ncbi:MAG TPA: hypothetical protein IAC35_06955 [Candidatus Cryptobacteroides merdipullorum]|uniref:Uncharacterized protein n=1 Tax=Candidatus Cryptobacteroides merdipullorum TaxID=2840771 RepID=A0A9D1GNT6_9BACT|nr:hypothetical protein [Candidatus Cryptobacteroides merdipullorum]
MNGKTPSMAGCCGQVWAETAYGRCDGTSRAVHGGAALEATGGAWWRKVICRWREGG